MTTQSLSILPNVRNFLNEEKIEESLDGKSFIQIFLMAILYTSLVQHQFNLTSLLSKDYIPDELLDEFPTKDWELIVGDGHGMSIYQNKKEDRYILSGDNIGPNYLDNTKLDRLVKGIKK